MRATEDNEGYTALRALLTDRGANDRCVVSDVTERLLLDGHQVDGDKFWRDLANEAEHHGVAPLIEPLIMTLYTKWPQSVPDDTRRTFVALASRHRRAAAAREQCVDQLLAVFSAANIPIVLLKGAVLAHRIYRSPELRPMVDIDVLIDPRDVQRAVAVATRLGYAFASGYASRFAGDHHHLPVAAKNVSGFRIALEIHVDALSPNQAHRLTLSTLAERPRRFRRGPGPDGMALGHMDMLRHLTHHAFEPARRIRLIHLYDLWRYQAVFRDEIDWQALEAHFSDVIVILRLVSHVFSGARLPDGRSSSKREPVPAGVGLGMVPLSEIAMMGFAARLEALFNPPAWWLHGFYSVPPEKSLFLCRTIQHPATVARWLATRLAALLRFAPSDPAVADHGRRDRASRVNP